MRSFFWIYLLAVSIIGTSNLSVADTYNFYFKNPKKSGETTSESSPDLSVTNPVEEPQAVQPLTRPANGVEPTASSANPPIIINNHNQIGIPPMQGYPTQPTASLPSEMSTSARLEKTPPSRHRLGFGFTIFNHDPGVSSLDRIERSFSQTGYGIDSENLGTEVSFGFIRRKGVSLNTYVGARNSQFYDDWRLHAGADLEMMPIQSASDEFNLPAFEAGFILGISTLSAHSSNILSGHTGLRMNFNFSNDFGLSIIGRANFGYFMGQAALTTRI